MDDWKYSKKMIEIVGHEFRKVIRSTIHSDDFKVFKNGVLNELISIVSSVVIVSMVIIDKWSHDKKESARLQYSTCFPHECR